ncbi:MAG TPA: hypothetical protein VMX94_06430 [Armatimonadota bacterium]|nr:hypothetical protein [Armatimonadota bacterium]
MTGIQPFRTVQLGPGVYVPQSAVEAEVISGLRDLIGVCGDPKGFTRQVDEELRRIWETSNGHDPHAEHRLAEVERRIESIRRSIEDGVPDTRWAYQRMSELLAEQERLQGQSRVVGEAPQIDAETALTYRRETEKVLSSGDNSERKQILRSWVDHIRLTPETLEVEINYRVPEFVVNRVGAGACFVRLHQWYSRRGWSGGIGWRRMGGTGRPVGRLS